VFEVRKDLRQERVFTVDPDTAKDLDDALSIKLNDDGTYDVGVHIADVSYFVQAQHGIRSDARKRATSVYLVQRAVPMLPPTLSEQLCSLNPGQKRLSFSIYIYYGQGSQGHQEMVWQNRLSSEPSTLVQHHVHSSAFVRSAAKLSYAEAQKVIDGHLLGDLVVAPSTTLLTLPTTSRCWSPCEAYEKLAASRTALSASIRFVVL